VARKGTAAGRSGEEKTGGPGGVLRCAVAGPGPEPGLGVPRAAARPGEKTRGGGVKGAWANGGDACADGGCGCGRCPGGVSSMPAALAADPVAARRSGAEGGARGGRIGDPDEECDEEEIAGDGEMGLGDTGRIRACSARVNRNRRHYGWTSASYWSGLASFLFTRRAERLPPAPDSPTRGWVRPTVCGSSRPGKMSQQRPCFFCVQCKVSPPSGMIP